MNAILESKARRGWLAFIAMFFVAQGGLWAWAIATVSSDRSHAVVADYDARALDWDAQRAEREASAALGWSATVDVGEAQLVVRIVDRDGHLVDADTMATTVFHKAEAARRRTVELQRVAPGVWQAPFVPHRDGAWVVELVAARGSDRFTTIATLTLD